MLKSIISQGKYLASSCTFSSSNTFNLFLFWSLDHLGDLRQTFFKCPTLPQLWHFDFCMGTWILCMGTWEHCAIFIHMYSKPLTIFLLATTLFHSDGVYVPDSSIHMWHPQGYQHFAVSLHFSSLFPWLVQFL